MKTILEVDTFTLELFRVEPSSDPTVVVLNILEDGKLIDTISFWEEEAERLGKILLSLSRGEI
jgi:hypothetical protein